MHDVNAARLLVEVMSWKEQEPVLEHVKNLQLLAHYKYDLYQQYSPGQRFIENLALWLERLEPQHRDGALDLVKEKLIFFSDREISHLVENAYPDLIVQERLRLVAEECDIPEYKVGVLSRHKRFEELKIKSIYLGLSDGARTNELRRASNHQINNEQIWQAYELGEYKSDSMLEGLQNELKKAGLNSSSAHFNLVWLLDDFSGSGNTYIRYDSEKQQYKGKLTRIYNLLHERQLIEPANYEVFLVLFVATRQAIDHIEYWSERFTSENGFKPLQLRVQCILERDLALKNDLGHSIQTLLSEKTYFDERANDKHMKVGGADGRLGFADCALPLVLSHNTPNNSIYLLWGPEDFSYPGLFPRVVRHRDIDGLQR